MKIFEFGLGSPIRPPCTNKVGFGHVRLRVKFLVLNRAFLLLTPQCRDRRRKEDVLDIKQIGFF